MKLLPNKPHPNDTKVKLTERYFNSEFACKAFRKELPKDFIILREDDVSLAFGEPKWRLVWYQPVRSFYVDRA